MLKLWKTDKWDCSVGMDFIWPEKLSLANYNLFDMVESPFRDINIKLSDPRLKLPKILKMMSKEKKITTVKDVHDRDFNIDMQELPLALPIVSHSCYPYWHKSDRSKDIENILPAQGTLIMAVVAPKSTSVYLVSLTQKPVITKEMYYLCFFGFCHALLDEIRRCSASIQLTDGIDVLTVDAEYLHILVENPVTLYEADPDLDLVNQILCSNMKIRDVCIHGGNDYVLDVIVDHLKCLPKLRKVYFIGELMDIAGWIAIAKILDQMNVKNLVLSQRSDMVDRGLDVVYREKIVNAMNFVSEPRIDNFWGAMFSEYLRYEREFQEIVCKEKRINYQVLLKLIEKSKFFIRENYLKFTGVVKNGISTESESPETKTLADLPNEVVEVITSMLKLDDVEMEDT